MIVQAGILGEATVIRFYAYVIKSLNHDFYYKGHCKNLVERLLQHNAGMTKSIRPYIPFQVIYTEEFDSREKAIEREKYFKSAAGRRYLKNKIVDEQNNHTNKSD